MFSFKSVPLFGLVAGVAGQSPVVTLWQNDGMGGARFDIYDNDPTWAWTYRVCDRCEEGDNLRGPSGEQFYNDQISSFQVHPGYVVQFYDNSCGSCTDPGGTVSSLILPNEEGYYYNQGLPSNDALSMLRFKRMSHYVQLLQVDVCFQSLMMDATCSISGRDGEDCNGGRLVREYSQGRTESASMHSSTTEKGYTKASATVGASNGFFSASSSVETGTSWESSITQTSSYSSVQNRKDTFDMIMTAPYYVGQAVTTITTNLGRDSSQGGAFVSYYAPTPTCHTTVIEYQIKPGLCHYEGCSTIQTVTECSAAAAALEVCPRTGCSSGTAECYEGAPHGSWGNVYTIDDRQDRLPGCVIWDNKRVEYNCKRDSTYNDVQQMSICKCSGSTQRSAPSQMSQAPPESSSSSSDSLELNPIQAPQNLMNSSSDSSSTPGPDGAFSDFNNVDQSLISSATPLGHFGRAVRAMAVVGVLMPMW